MYISCDCWVFIPTCTIFLRRVVPTFGVQNCCGALKQMTQCVVFAVGPSLLHVPHVQFMSFMWWMSPDIPRFSLLLFHLCCYCERKQKVKQGRLGTRLELYYSGNDWKLGRARREEWGLNLWDKICMHTLSVAIQCHVGACTDKEVQYSQTSHDCISNFLICFAPARVQLRAIGRNQVMCILDGVYARRATTVSWFSVFDRSTGRPHARACTVLWSWAARGAVTWGWPNVT